MAPEQIRGSTRFLQPTVDVHALGVMCYELLTHKRPYEGSTPMETLQQIQEAEPPALRKIRPTIPRDLETICLKCLEKSPDRRYLTAQSLVDDLDRFLDQRPILARRTSVASKMVLWMQRYPAVTFLLGIICTLCSALGVGATWYSMRLESSLKTAGTLQSQSLEDQELIQSLAYAGQVRRAQELLETGYQHAAGELIRNWIPKSGQPDRRGFEWYYLQAAAGGQSIPIPRQSASDEATSLFSGAVTSDSRTLLIGIQGAIERWDLRSQTMSRLPGVQKTPYHIAAIAEAPSGDLLFARDQDSKIYRWSVTQDREVDSFCSKGYATHCNRLQVTPNGQYVLSLLGQSPFFAPSCQLRCQSLPSGRVEWHKIWPSEFVTDIATNPRTGLINCLVDTNLEILDLSGKQVSKIPLTVADSQPLSMTISHAGNWLAISLDNRRILIYRHHPTEFWKYHGELPITREPHNPVDKISWGTFRNPVEFANHENQLYSACGTELHWWDVEVLAELGSLHNLPEPVRLLKANSVSDVVIWGTALEAGVWDPQKSGVQIPGHSKETWSVAFSPDGQFLATGSDDETIGLWNLKTGRLRRSFSGHAATVSTVAFSPDGKRLASASLDKTIRIWNLEREGEFQTLSGHPGSVRCLSWSADSRYLISGDRNASGEPVTAIVWDTSTLDRVHTWNDHRGRVQLGLFIPNRPQCLTAGFDKRILLRDLNTGETIQSFDDTAEIHCGAVLNQGQWLATGNKHGLIRIWEIQTGKLIRELRGHAVVVRALAATADGSVLASASDDKTVRIWNARNGESLLILRGHLSSVRSVAFSPDDQTLASGDFSGQVKMWYAPRTP